MHQALAAITLGLCALAPGAEPDDRASVQNVTVWRPATDTPAESRSSWIPGFLRMDWWKDKSEARPDSAQPADGSPKRRWLDLPFLKQRRDTASDRLLTTRARSAIYGESDLARCSISVTAEQSVIVLRGEVPSAPLRDRAERLARHIKGAEDVRNEIRVQSAPATVLLSPISLAGPAPLVESDSQKPPGAPPITFGAEQLSTEFPRLLAPVQARAEPSGSQADRTLIPSRSGLPAVTSYSITRSAVEVDSSPGGVIGSLQPFKF